MVLVAEIGAGNVVQRVVIGPDGLDGPAAIAWCAEHIGGWWVETRQGAEPERYAGKGMVYAPDDPRTFLYPGEV
jgi:hypothetical protein